MAEQTRYTKPASDHRASLDIPWMRRWEEKRERERSASKEDRQARLVRIDYMTMLAELEFH